MVRIREELGKQITEDDPYGKEYIGWRKGDELRRKKAGEKEILKHSLFFY
jgi:hypothetical protein